MESRSKAESSGPNSYAALLSASRPAIKSADRNAQVVVGGLPDYSWTSLGQLYKVRGVRKLFDAVAIHPYTAQPSGVITILQKVRSVMNAAGDKSKPITADELGWPSSLGQSPEQFDWDTTEQGQASKLSALLPLLARNRSQLKLSSFYYYTWIGAEYKGDPLSFDFSGLLKLTNGQVVAKPALNAFRTGTLKLEGCKSKRIVATNCAH
jgi:hypothetical protein